MTQKITSIPRLTACEICYDMERNLTVGIPLPFNLQKNDPLCDPTNLSWVHFSISWTLKRTRVDSPTRSTAGSTGNAPVDRGGIKRNDLFSIADHSALRICSWNRFPALRKCPAEFFWWNL
ncbi:hypothetical protein TNCV_2016621 [Trichonephila clavipes]|nr:hypothetical protein TNCV_2016621 [Trichonephila clavipes]